LPERLLVKNAQVQDAWTTTHPATVDDPGFISTPEEAVHEWGITCDSPLITYNQTKKFWGYVKDHQGKRLDYVFYRCPSKPSNLSIQCLTSKVVFTELPPGKSHSYSDHFGLEATFAIETAVPPPAPHSTNYDTSTIQQTIEALNVYLPMVQKRSNQYLIFFLLSLLALLGLIIGSAWLPYSWINPIFLFFTVAGSWFATTMLYVGFIFGNWEANGLTSLIEELQLVSL
jgi:sphingomyelin phosphodiesterase 2